MYFHCPSSEYHVLYRNRKHLGDASYILAVPLSGSSRCIGVTSHFPGMEKVMMAWDIQAPAYFPPPIVFSNCLHWDLDWIKNDVGIIIFDTIVESFRLMRRPTSATRFCLCDMEGLIGFSCFDDQTVVKIWVLEDYDREIWALKYQVQFPMESLCATWHLVLTPEGYMHIYNNFDIYILHCDNTGKLIEEFRWESQDPGMDSHWYKESLVKHDFFPRHGSTRARQPNLFRRL
jgi:hypothetical protein